MNIECKKWLEQKLAKIDALESYVPEKTIEKLAKQYELSPADIVKLNFNENLYIPREKLVALLKEVADECDLRLYPQEEEEKLREAIGEYLRLPQASVAVGNSSDEVMDRITRLFLERGDRAVTFAPTFSVFRYCVKYQGAEYVAVPLRGGFSLDVETMRAAFTPETKLLYLCSPNNPTGNQFEQDAVEALIEEFPGIVMVDEAYGEYADYSVVPLIDKYENLVVLRTFSKAFGLAGLRLGYALANPLLANAVNKIPAPYAINVVSLTMGRKLLENAGVVREAVAALKTEREKLINELNAIRGVEAFDSRTNFVLFNTAKPYEDVYVNMLKRGLILKKLGKLLMYENCLRTTVGLPGMNGKLLKALREYLGD
ncbi:histidinol-phosphate transaminase [Candidatus Bathyarchaeota archaeon A05DMB-2]|jgi:histidinol-phosphate aminotransferase|nr:histidinol-phosphate transaminase [Candidatus Bathyarchaeota archaeon A05DMB-2]